MSTPGQSMAPHRSLVDSGDTKPSTGGLPLMLAGPSVEIASHSGPTPARVSTANEEMTSGGRFATQVKEEDNEDREGPEPLNEEQTSTGAGGPDIDGWNDHNNPGITDTGEVTFAVNRRPVWFKQHEQLLLDNRDKVERFDWKGLEKEFDKMAEGWRLPEYSKTFKAIKEHVLILRKRSVPPLDLPDIIRMNIQNAKEFLPFLSEEEKEFLAIDKGDEIIAAYEAKMLSFLCLRLVEEMYRPEFEKKLIPQRKAKWLKGRLLEQLKIGEKSWFHRQRNRKLKRLDRERAARAFPKLSKLPTDL